MKRRLVRLAGWIAGLLVAVAMTATLAVLWVYTSESGARFLIGRLVAASDGAIAIDGVEGRINDELHFRGLRYQDGSQQVAIDEIRLRLGLYRIFAGELAVESLRASRVEYRSLPGDGIEAEAPPQEAVEAPAFVLPLDVRLVRSSISELIITQGEETVEIQRLVLAGIASESQALLQRFEFTVQDFFVSVQGVTDWSDGIAVDGLASWSGELDDRPWLGSVDVAGRWPVLSIEQELIQPFEQSATGNLLLGETPAFDLSVVMPVLGEFTLIGGLDQESERWRARGTGTLNGESLVADVSAAATADGAVDIEQLSVTYGDNRAVLAGNTGDVLDLVLDFDFSDLASIAALAGQEPFRSLLGDQLPLTSLTGEAVGRVSAAGRLDNLAIDTDIVLTGSRLAGLPLSAELTGAGTLGGDDSVALEGLVLDIGSSHLQAAGSISLLAPLAEGFDINALGVDLDVSLSSDDLAEINTLLADEFIRMLLPEELALEPLAGSLQTQFALSGNAMSPRINGVFSGSSLAYGELEVETVSLDADIEAVDGGDASIRLAASNEIGAIELAAGGQWSQQLFTGSVDELVLTEPVFGSWALAAAAPFAVGADTIEIANACLVNQTSELCGEWQRNPQSELLVVRADDFELAVLNFLLPPELSLNGSVNVNATLDSPTGNPSGQLTVQANDIDIGLAMSETDSFTTRLASVSVDAALEDFGLSLNATVESSQQGRAVVAMTSADIRNEDSPIEGRFEVDWPDLAALSLLSPDVGEVAGRLNVAVDVQGTVLNPQVSGDASFSDGRVAIPEWGILIERINGDASSAGGESLDFSGSGFVEDSELLVSGQTELDPAAGWPTRLSLSGDRVVLARRPDATVLASPDFEVVIDLPRIEVTGQVEIPEASLAVEELPSQAVRVSPDSVVHGVADAEVERPLDVVADITVTLGDDVSYNGAGLIADLGGEFRLRYESGLSPIANGVLGVAGSYEAYGQSLTLERGELLFSGPLNDPALDVLAVREIGTTRVGIRLSGTLLEPSSSLYSDPPMSELDALSYLISGGPFSSADEFDNNALQSTALALGVRQALPAIQRVGETLGLDELAIEANDVDAGALMAGKYLSPRLYMSYSYGLFNRLGGFLLRYEITDSLSLETRSGSEKAMDLLYSIEKD